MFLVKDVTPKQKRGADTLQKKYVGGILYYYSIIIINYFSA